MMTYCETYLCNQQAKYFIGREDGPLMIKMNLCEGCKQSILDHLIKEDRDKILDKIQKMKEEEWVADAKERYGGKEYKCKQCDEIFYSPPMLASHVKATHGAGEVQVKSKV